MFDPAPFQVLVPYFDIEIGHLKQIYRDPELPVEMDLELSLGGQVSGLSLSFFDELGWEIDSAVWESTNPITGLPGGTFEFGYRGDINLSSERYPLDIANVLPRFENNGFSVSLICDLALEPLMTSAQYSGTGEDLIKKYAEMYDYDVNIDPPLGVEHMMEIGATDAYTTDPREMVFRKQTHENDWRFIQRIVQSFRDAEGKCGYRVNIGSDGGRKVLNVVKPRNAAADYTYIVQKDSTVVQLWAPELNYASPYGGYDTHYNTYETLTGYSSKLALNKAVTEKFQETNGYTVYEIVNSRGSKDKPKELRYVCAEDIDESVTNGAIRQRTGGSHSRIGGINPILAKHIEDWLGNNKAILTVAGDPQIMPDKMADVTFNYPLNFKNKNIKQKHYSSGIYYITRVHHRIGAEGFTTTMVMERAGIPQEPEAQSQGES